MTRPLDQHDDAVAEADQEEDVNKQPRKPGVKAAKTGSYNHNAQVTIAGID